MNNDKMKKVQEMPVTGISSLLVIFAVLCLVVFSVLTISTVKADEKLADRTVNSVVKYYEAEGNAEKTLALLRQGEIPDGVTRKGTAGDGYEIFGYECRISDTQKIEIEVEVKDGDYRILRWQSVYDAGWKADESIDVWDGETGKQP
ncbi:MAG: hypothetical protein Q4C14_05370 [Bacillota bacterium]|nr:hypothetical protein [Bacillota bacterium]